jgi:sirohydrochlorin ferrochelatase
MDLVGGALQTTFESVRDGTLSEALLIAAHGSRDPAGVKEFWEFAESWQQVRPDRLQAAGFLEFERPTIGAAIDQLVDRGAKAITVVPAMLMAAGHVKNDVPSEIQEGRLRHPSVTFRMAGALEVHPALLELCYVRYREALERLTPIAPQQTVLLLVGRGTSDPDANANNARISRFLWESSGVGWATVAYSGLAAPSVDEALTLCRRMGFARIVVQPYFLFDGILVKRICEAVQRHAALDTSVEIVTTAHLRQHPLLLKAFEDRAHEATHGAPVMNCDLCKYRVRLVGREIDLGAPQFGHHHHVRATEHEHDRGSSRSRGRSQETVPAEHPWDDRLLRRLSVL